MVEKILETPKVILGKELLSVCPCPPSPDSISGNLQIGAEGKISFSAYIISYQCPYSFFSYPSPSFMPLYHIPIYPYTCINTLHMQISYLLYIPAFLGSSAVLFLAASPFCLCIPG